MTRDEIIKMSMEAGFAGWKCDEEKIERFAALVAEAEREVCAKTCEDFEDATDRLNRPSGYECAAAIRARGEK